MIHIPDETNQIELLTHAINTIVRLYDKADLVMVEVQRGGEQRDGGNGYCEARHDGVTTIRLKFRGEPGEWE